MNNYSPILRRLSVFLSAVASGMLSGFARSFML